MTTLYKPVQIESAEQAEALPDDAIVIGVETGERYIKGLYGEWWGITEMGTPLGVDLDARDIVQALVPIEAEEETCSVQTRGQISPEWRTRYFTPWTKEDA